MRDAIQGIAGGVAVLVLLPRLLMGMVWTLAWLLGIQPFDTGAERRSAYESALRAETRYTDAGGGSSDG